MPNGTRLTILAACAALLWCAAVRAEPSATATDDMTQQPNSKTPAPMEITKPMKMDEPMAGGMMREGMQKSDVKDAADKKDEKMKKRLEEEEQSMPPMPEQAPRK